MLISAQKHYGTEAVKVSLAQKLWNCFDEYPNAFIVRHPTYPTLGKHEIKDE